MIPYNALPGGFGSIPAANRKPGIYMASGEVHLIRVESRTMRTTPFRQTILNYKIRLLP